MSEVTSVNGQVGAVILTAADVNAVSESEVGSPEGVASLDSGGTVPSSQLSNLVAVVNGGSGPTSIGTASNVNTGQFLLSTGGADPTGNNPLQFLSTNQMVEISTAALLNSSGIAPAGIFQISAYGNNTGTDPMVPIFGQGVGLHVWGANFLAYADGGSTSAAIGTEIDVGNFSSAATTISGAQTLEISAKGTNAVYATHITELAETSSLTIGMTVIASGVLPGTTITAILSGTEIEVSQPIVKANTKATFTFYRASLTVGATTGASSTGTVTITSGGKVSIFRYTGLTATTFTGLKPQQVESTSVASGDAVTYSTGGTATGLAVVAEGGTFGGAPSDTAIQIQSAHTGNTFVTGINFSGAGVPLGKQPVTGAAIEFTGLNANSGMLFSNGEFENGIGVVGSPTMRRLIYIDGGNFQSVFEFAKATAQFGINFGNESNVYTTAALAFGGGHNIEFSTTTGTKIGTATGQKIGFWNATPVAKPTVTGSRSAGTALTNLLQELAAIGLLTNSTTT